jgi:hypothetical protein
MGIIMSSHFMIGLWIENGYWTAIADTFEWIFSYVNNVSTMQHIFECCLGWSGGNKDTGSTVDKVTPADCEASG